MQVNSKYTILCLYLRFVGINRMIVVHIIHKSKHLNNNVYLKHFGKCYTIEIIIMYYHFVFII